MSHENIRDLFGTQHSELIGARVSERDSATNVYGGSFTEVHGNIEVHHHHNDAGFQALSSFIAANALHDSSERHPAPTCHPGTRNEIIDVIEAWIADHHSGNHLFWLHGLVGVGKSTIIQSITNLLLGVNKPVAGAFFFGRGNQKRGVGHYLFSTIAYQLALNIPELRGPIDKIMRDDPALPLRNITTQFRRLIVEPFRHLQEVTISPRTVVIDGLDECEDDEEIQQLIIKYIDRAVNKDRLPLRFVIASRPEPQIRAAFDQSQVTQNDTLNDADKSSKDIEKYLRDKFNDVYRRRSSQGHMPNICLPWPSDEIIHRLVKKASGQFAFASTVVKFVDSKYHLPSKQLEIILDPNRQSTALSLLDNLYNQILRAAYPNPKVLVDVIGYVLLDSIYGNTLLKFVGEYRQFELIEFLLDMEPGTVALVLQGLRALQHDDITRVPLSFEAESPVIAVPLSFPHFSFAHISFCEYITDTKRSGEYFVDMARSTSMFLIVSLLKGSQRIVEIFQEVGASKTAQTRDQACLQCVRMWPPCFRKFRPELNNDMLVALFHRISLEFETSMAKIDLNVTLALGSSTRLLGLLYQLTMALRTSAAHCRALSESFPRYSIVLERCLDHIFYLQGSLHDLVQASPFILAISGIRIPIHTLSLLLKVDEAYLRSTLINNTLFAGGGITSSGCYQPPKWEVRRYAANKLSNYCCLSSITMRFVELLCSSVLQPRCSVDRHLLCDALTTGEYGFCCLSYLLTHSDKAVQQDCSTFPSNSHNHEFYANLGCFEFSYTPGLVNAPLTVVHCIWSVIHHLISERRQAHLKDNKIWFANSLFPQVFQLSALDGVNVVTLREPFLAYHKLLSQHQAYYDSHEVLELDFPQHELRTFLTEVPAPLPGLHKPPRLSKDLFIHLPYSAAFLVSFLYYLSHKELAGEMYVGPIASILSQVETFRTECPSDPKGIDEVDIHQYIEPSGKRLRYKSGSCILDNLDLNSDDADDDIDGWNTYHPVRGSYMIDNLDRVHELLDKSLKESDRSYDW